MVVLLVGRGKWGVRTSSPMTAMSVRSLAVPLFDMIDSVL